MYKENLVFRFLNSFMITIVHVYTNFVNRITKILKVFIFIMITSIYSTVTALARFLGWSGSHPFEIAT